MSREVDLRDFSISKVTTSRTSELQANAANRSGLAGGPQITIAKFDETTGNPALIKVQSAPPGLGQPPSYIQRALEFLQSNKDVLGLAPTQPAEFAPDPLEQRTSSGAAAVHLQQKYKGIPLFQAAQTVRFAPNGALTEAAGSTVTILQEMSVSPKLRSEQAVLRAALHCAEPTADETEANDSFGQPLKAQKVDVTGFAPKVIVAFTDKPEQPTVLEAGPFGDEIRANLIWFVLDRNTRLAWEVILTMPKLAGQFRTIVDAQDGTILYCRNLMQSVASQGNVYLADGSQQRRVTTFPKPWDEYGLIIPDDLRNRAPDDWVEMDSTLGNSTFAHLGDSGTVLRGESRNGVLTFDPADPVGDDQKVLNIFYYNCFMHDFSYLLGFREADGNFQQNNFNRGGLPTDRVDARAHSMEVWATANFHTPVDGSSPIMNMGLVTSTNRHTAFDASVVFHEFTHGITNRLVGGPTNTTALEAAQSAGMGEGWSDYIACTISGSPVVAAWVSQNPNGIRKFPYDSNFPANTENFGSLGTGRYTEVHNIGEIWCATLAEMNRNLVAKVGTPRGDQLGLQLVVDALKLSPSNPSFLDGRDSILTALENKLDAGQLSSADHNLARSAIWAAFSKFGMGPGARSNGAYLVGILADMSLPPEELVQTPSIPAAQVIQREITPALDIPDNNSVGVLSTMAITQVGTARAIKVSVDISHTFIGDLQIALVAPSGKWVILHDRVGGEQSNLNTTYDSASTLSLAPLINEPINGNWLLGVRDLAQKDVGKLNKWGLELNIAGEGLGLTSGANVLNVHFEFPDDSMKQKFKLGFQTWLKQYEQSQTPLPATPRPTAPTGPTSTAPAIPMPTAPRPMTPRVAPARPTPAIPVAATRTVTTEPSAPHSAATPEEEAAPKSASKKKRTAKRKRNRK